METNQPFLLIHPEDSVVITLKSFSAGETIIFNEQTILVKEEIPIGHKIAIKDHQVNQNVVRYGFPIGSAKEPIKIGDWVHTHNVQTNLKGMLEYSYQPVVDEKVRVKESELTFQGFERKNGDVGIRNEIWVINTVGCINKTAEILVKMAANKFEDRKIDGVFHYPHPFGCSQLGDDLLNTQKILSNLVNHSNAGGVLVLGLGCENNYIQLFKKVIGEYDEDRVRFLVSQEVDDELEEGLSLIEELVDYAESFERKPIPVSKLRVGLKCGGSDGFSGVTANPLVGSFSDLLISHGGTTLLTEVPEMFGAETILMNRAENQEVFEKTVNLINDFKKYYMKHDQVIYENPSPGNKSGGITTLEEKSLGCVQKGGYAKVVDVLPYGDRVTKHGLNLVQGPGNDLISVTALAAAGAHIVLFTTGRGTPFGGPVPTVKISTNNSLFNRKKNWIDFNAGSLVDGTEKAELAEDLFAYVLRVASGEAHTKNELNGFKEIAIFKDGVIL